MFLNVVPIVCIIIKLPNFGKLSHFVSDAKVLDEIFVRALGGLLVQLCKIKCAVFGLL
jgi:hypothetical protein